VRHGGRGRHRSGRTHFALSVRAKCSEDAGVLRGGLEKIAKKKRALKDF